jgi:hypothetical protein
MMIRITSRRIKISREEEAHFHAGLKEKELIISAKKFINHDLE